MRWLSLLAFCSLLAPVAAQVSFTSPATYEFLGGGGVASNVALNAAPWSGTIRYQVTDPTMPPGKATVNRLEFRPARFYSSRDGMGRSFSSLTLSLGYSAKTITKTFSTNWQATPSKVFFAARFSLPTVSNYPIQRWGSAGTFVFSKPFLLDSSQGTLLQEWQHAGATLANGHTLKTRRYNLDGLGENLVLQPGSRAGAWFVPDPGKKKVCNDTATPGSYGHAVASMGLRLYSDAYSVATLRGKAAVGASVFYTAPLSPVVSMLSLGGSDAGIDVGAKCNRIHVNTGFPLLIIAGNTSSSPASMGLNGPKRFPVAPFKWNDSWAGNTLYLQSVWDDSKTRRFAATLATKMVLPPKPRLTAQMAATYLYEAASVQQGPTQSTAANIISRYVAR